MWTDILQTARVLRRRRKTTSAVIVLLGSGVACVGALFAIVDGLLLRPLPFPDQDRLVAIGGRARDRNGLMPLTQTAIADLAGPELEVAGYAPPPATEQSTGDTIRIAAVTPAFFRVLGVRAQMGTLLDERDVGTDALVVSHATWLSRFGGDTEVLGRRVNWNGRGYVILGVAPEGIDFPAGSEAWAPAARPSRPETMAAFRAIGRLRDGTSFEQARSRRPDVWLVGLREWVKPGGTFGLVMLLAAATLVLAVAWVQVAALQAGRAAEDRFELNVRRALGASPAHLMRLAGIEAAWLGTGTFGVAAFLTPIFTSAIVARLPPQMTRGQPIAVDVRALAGAAAVSLLGVLLCTVAPRLRGWGDAHLAQLRTLPDRQKTVRARHWLLLLQVSVAVPLVYLAGVAWLSSSRLAEMSLGFEPEGLLVARLPTALSAGGDGDRGVLATRRSVFRDLEKLPGVSSVAAGSSAPFGSRTSIPLTLGIARTDETLSALHTVVDPEYFATLGIPLRSGRTFLPSDHRDAPLVAIVSDLAATRLRAKGRDVGAQVLVGGLPAMVVGVVGDVRDSVHPAIAPEARVYVCADQWPPPAFLYVRVGSQTAVADRVRTRLAEAWPNERPTPTPVDERIVAASADFRGRSVILALLSTTAIGLTMLGVFGGVSALVRDRTREMAIRLACGAPGSDIATRVVGGILAWVAAGAGAGLVIGWLSARVLASLLFGTAAFDPIAAAAAVVALPGLAVFVALGPAWRCTRIATAQALRE